MTPEPASEASSQWSVTGRFRARAVSMARRIRAAFWMQRPSSEKAAAPASARAAMSLSSWPRRPVVSAAIGKTLTTAVSAARARMARVISGRSLTGVVLGMAKTEVKPPAAAARVPVRMVSLCSCPGSRRWTWMSMKPGATTRPGGLEDRGLGRLQARRHGGDAAVLDQDVRGGRRRRRRDRRPGRRG